jgi:hypothetical protein
MPPEVHQVAEQHEDRNHNEEPVVLEKLAHLKPPLEQMPVPPWLPHVSFRDT